MYCYEGELKFRGSGISVKGNARGGFYKVTYLDIGEHRVRSVRMHEILADVLDQALGKKVALWGKRILFVNILFGVEVDDRRESMPLASFIGTMLSYILYILLVPLAAAIGGAYLAAPVALWIIYDIYSSLRLYFKPPRP